MVKDPENTSTHTVEDVGRLLLDIGTLLLSCGANTERIRLSVSRFSEALGYNSELLITHHAIMLTMSKNDRQVYSHLKRCSSYSVNFSVLSGVSRLSWAVVTEPWSMEKIKSEVERLKKLPSYPRWLILGAVAMAGASFCRLYGGDLLSMGLTFMATGLGLFTLQELSRRKFNFYLCVVAASFVASLLAGAFLQLNQEATREHSLAAVILFLVPGISLINAFSDFMDGNMLNGFLRGFNGLMIAFCIALGWVVAILACGV